MKTKRQKCIDPSVGGKIPLEIVFPIATGKVPFPHDLNQQPELSPESRRHLELCECCRDDLRENLALWYRKGMASYRFNQAQTIVDASDRGDPTILRRTITSGTGFFKPGPDQRNGVFVLVATDGFVHEAEEKTLEEFNHMR
jgi:hypothetical protein